MEGGHALWALSKQALKSDAVKAAIENNVSDQVVGALGTSEEGRAYLEEFRKYLAVWGQRTDVFCELGAPSWEEDPSTPISNLKDFVGQPDRDVEDELAQLASEREKAVASARERLAGYPQEARDHFEFLLSRAQSGAKMHEDHNYWIDQIGSNKVRQAILEVGRRLESAGSVDEANDVFYLTAAEIRDAALNPGGAARRDTVAERKAEMEHFGRMNPSPLGTMPSDREHSDPMSVALGKFFGRARVQSSERPNVITGNPGSPGKTKGTARVIRTLADSHRLGRGDVLVTTTTMPAWTPLFGTASAVVTDAGGVLSHCAIVAREYGIPAVVGTSSGTTAIKDGQTIEVDGNAGEVRILASSD